MSERSKKVLIITYYWPPSGGSGVQRWLKFVKYLPSFGWHPYVFTPQNPSFDIKDPSLISQVPDDADVIHFPIWEPYEAFFKLSAIFGKTQSNKPTEVVGSKNKRSIFQSLSLWIRGTFFVPDPRIFWVKPSVKFLTEFLSDNNISKVITTGPPHSIHLIGLKLKNELPSITWVADFRDPWTEWGFLDSLELSKWARRKHRQLEAKVLARADHVITITPFYKKRFEALAKREITLLTNGFDEDDFKNIEYRKQPEFIIRHVGIVNEKCNPRPFIDVIAELMSEKIAFAKQVKIEFIGEVHPDFKAFVLAKPAVAAATTFRGNVPHRELLPTYGSAALLLLVLHGYKDAEGYMPGKLFEYIATGLPILGIGPEDGDAATLLSMAKTGKMIDAAFDQAIKSEIVHRFEEWANSDSPIRKPTDALRYSRREVTRSLTELLQFKP